MSDYADKIAGRAIEAVNARGESIIYDADTLHAALAQAAREGYALGYAAGGGK